MRIDLDYLKEILKVCQDSEKSTFTIKDFEKAGFKCETDERFEFHMKLLNDRFAVVRDDGVDGIGLQKGADGSKFKLWSCTLLRLTADGHDLAEALSKDEIFSKLKEIGGMTASVLMSLSSSLLNSYVSKQLDL